MTDIEKILADAQRQEQTAHRRVEALRVLQGSGLAVCPTPDTVSFEMWLQDVGRPNDLPLRVAGVRSREADNMWVWETVDGGSCTGHWGDLIAEVTAGGLFPVEYFAATRGKPALLSGAPGFGFDPRTPRA